MTINRTANINSDGEHVYSDADQTRLDRMWERTRALKEEVYAIRQHGDENLRLVQDLLSMVEQRLLAAQEAEPDEEEEEREVEDRDRDAAYKRINDQRDRDHQLAVEAFREGKAKAKADAALALDDLDAMSPDEALTHIVETREVEDTSTYGTAQRRADWRTLRG